jgi:hypothetical protein
MDLLPPELLRRFKLQVWYFDLLTKPERAALWPIYLKRYGHDIKSPLPNDEGWTGAEIRNCCELGQTLSMSVQEVAENYIIPVSKSNSRSLDEMRKLADGNFLSVSSPGPYRVVAESAVPTKAGRKIQES